MRGACIRGGASKPRRHACPSPMTRDLISIRARRDDLSISAGIFYAQRVAIIRAFTYCESGLAPHAGFTENRAPLPSNGKLVFNIRISTEDEINGTVKGDV